MLTLGFRKPAQILVRAYLVALLLALVAAGILLLHSGRDWGYGDWLINYQGGFVRRGLMGQICFLIGRALHVDPIYPVAAIGILCYGIIFSTVWRLLDLSSWRWWVIALVVSPATLAFPVISRTSFRKEILYFALLGAFIAWLRRRAPVSDAALIAFLALVFPFLVLSHEPLMAYMPYFAAALFIELRSFKRVVAILALPIVLAGIAAVAVLSHIGDATIVQKICDSLGDPDLATCSKAVQTLAQSRQDALLYVSMFIEKYHYLPQYSVGLLLGLIPIAAALHEFHADPKLKSSLYAILSAAAVSVVLSLNLFRYGADWGRWIHIHLLSLCLLILLLDSHRHLSDSNDTRESNPPLPNRIAVAVFLLLYATCWSIPGTKDKPLFGYASLTDRLIHWNGSLTQ